MSDFAPQLRIPATYMRGGTSKGVFFRLQDLPDFAQTPGKPRDALLVRVIGSPDPYGKHTDGMGGATSSTSKTVIIAPASVPDHDVDYLYGQVSIDTAFVDWSGNCGNLSTAVGPFAIANGFIPAERIPQHGSARPWRTFRNSASPPPTGVAERRKACSSGYKTCRRPREFPARRAMRCCCA